MCDTGISIGTAFKHPALDLLFRLNGRQIRKRQIVLAFKVDAFVHELLAALIVDHPSDHMRETTLTRVTGCSRPDQIRMNHPAASEPEDGVEPSGERMHLCMCGRVHVWAAIRPRDKQRTVLLKKDSIFDERERKKKVGQAARASSMLGDLHDSPIASSLEFRH